MSLSPSALLPYSIEGFLSDEQVTRILRSIDAYKASRPNRLEAGANGVSLHENRELSLQEIIAIYEPAGRIEINTLAIPRDVIDILELAFYQHIEDVRRAYPSAHGIHGFTYVEYAVGQHFTPHADGVGHGQIAGFGVTLTNDFDGGEFVVKTCGSNRLWCTSDNGELRLPPGHDASTEWFRSLPKTEWLTRPIRGNAIFYGGALTHGSKPVTRGRLKKLLAFIH